MKIKILTRTTFLILLTSFAFMGCKEEVSDPCEGISCVNGGTCVNGDCLCPDNYTGPDCSQEKPPSKILIGKIDLNSFPQTKSGGSSWDLLDWEFIEGFPDGLGPDVYVVVEKESTNEIIYVSNFVEDLTSSYTLNNLSIEIDDPLARYSISAYDLDNNGDGEFMGGVLFYPYRKGQSFPSSRSVNCTDCETDWVISDLVYIFN